MEGPGTGAFCLRSNGHALLCLSSPDPHKMTSPTHTPSCLFQDVDER